MDPRVAYVIQKSSYGIWRRPSFLFCCRASTGSAFRSKKGVAGKTYLGGALQSAGDLDCELLAREAVVLFVGLVDLDLPLQGEIGAALFDVLGRAGQGR